MVGWNLLLEQALPPLTFCNLPRLSDCGIRTAALLDLRATTAFLLRDTTDFELRAPPRQLRNCGPPQRKT
jgi:hypothetical protein